jgi:hypothetical protein
MALGRKRSRSLPLSATEIANIARSNPYIQRLLDDPKLRKNVREALEAGRSAYGRVNNGHIRPQSLLEDRKLHADLARALGAARDATIILTYAQRKRRRGLTFGRAVVLIGIGGGIAIAASESLRSKVLDLLFGAEEEFQYTPPPAPPPAPASTSSVGAT